MRNASLKSLVGLLIAAAGCSDFTLVEPEPRPQAESLMGIALHADRSGSSRYELHALLFPGADTRGQPNEFADRALYVENNPLQPRVEASSQLWGYDWEETRADGGLHVDSIRIRPPVPAGSSLPGITVTIPIVGREDPEQVTWVEGEDLRLHVSPQVDPAPRLPILFSDWALELGDTCSDAGSGRALRIAGSGAHPPEFRIPWEWLASTTPAPAIACLRTVSAYRVPGAPYRMEVSLSLQVAWRITVAAGTSSANK
jgi:hypothetical protein